MASRTEVLSFSCQLLLHQLPPSCFLPRQQCFLRPRVTFWQVCGPFSTYKAGREVLRSSTGTVTKGLKNHCFLGWDTSVVGGWGCQGQLMSWVQSRVKGGWGDKKGNGLTALLNTSSILLLYTCLIIIVFFSFIHGKNVRPKTSFILCLHDCILNMMAVLEVSVWCQWC